MDALQSYNSLIHDPDYLGLNRWAVETPGKVALTGPGREPLTYSALWDHTKATSEALNEAGLHPGDIAALAIPNGPEFLSAALAITLRSACAPLDLDLTPEEFRAKLERIQPSTLILQEGCSSPAADIARELGMRIIYVRCPDDAPAGFINLGNVEDPAGGYRARQTDAALILMTSATTSAPKLVPRSRIALSTAAAYNARAFELTSADRYLSCMPLSHSHGISEAMAQFTVGGVAFCCPAFDAAQFTSWYEDFGPTWFSASPTMNRMILRLALEAPEVFRRGLLRFIVSSAAAPDQAVLVELEKLLGVPVVNGYGLTEVASATRSTPSLRKPGSVGKSFGVEIAILDDSGQFLPPEEEGEVLLRGPTVMSGYLDDPEANQAAFHDGWFRTGDIGCQDRDGFLFLAGRRKELINRGGKKISPHEVDHVLAAHPAIEEAAAFAIPHRTLGEEVAAAVVVRAGVEVSELQLRQFASCHLSAYKIPRRFVFLESIPRTPVGKPKRGELAERFLNLRARTAPERSPSHIEKSLIELWSRILGAPAIGVEDDFFDLGGDSLSAALMLTQAQQLSGPAKHPFDASAFYEQPTVASLAVALVKADAQTSGSTQGAGGIVLLQSNGTRVPFFCFSSSRIDPYQLRHVARELGPDQPFVVVSPPPAGQDDRLLRAQEISRQSIVSIRSVRAHGPYLIGGYCHGGVLAFETARQLMEEGKEVALLALFDTPTPGYPKIVREWGRYGRRASQILRQMLHGTVGITAHDAAQHARILWRIATRRPFAKANRLLASAGVKHPTEAEEWNTVVMREYVPQPIQAPILLFLGDDVPLNATVLSDRRLGWRDFAKTGFDIVRMPGDHVSMLAEANAPALAARLEEALKAAISVEPESAAVARAGFRS